MNRDSLFWFGLAILLIVFLLLPDPLFHLYIRGSDFGLPPLVDIDYPNMIKQLALYFPIGTFYVVLALVFVIGMGYESRKYE